jgi:hypothetical protein
MSSILGRYGDKGEQYYSGGPPEGVVGSFGYYERSSYIPFALAEAKKRGLYHGKFGPQDDRIQAVRRLKECWKIVLPTTGSILRLGDMVKNYKKFFISAPDDGDKYKMCIGWKEVLKLIRDNFPRVVE